MRARRALLHAAMLFAALSLATASLLAAGPGKPGSSQAPTPAEEPEGKIDGLALARPHGGFLGLQIVANRFVLTFYDAKKHRTPIDVARATLRWPVKYQPADERAVLNPAADGTSLTSEKNIRPPHHFRVYLSLFAEGSEDAIESYAVSYDN